MPLCPGALGAADMTVLILCTGHASVTVAEMVCFWLSMSASIGLAVLSGTSHWLFPSDAPLVGRVYGLSGAVNGLAF